LRKSINIFRLIFKK